MHNYEPLPIKATIQVKCFYSFYYSEFARSYKYLGESHDFWECVYVDKGEVMVTADDTQHLMKPGMIIFHKPNEFHSFYAHGGTAPNIVVFTFECKSRAMKWFDNKIVHLVDEERNLLAQMIGQAKQTYVFPFSNPFIRREEAPEGSEQLIRLYLETFLIRLLMEKPLQEVNRSELSSSASENDVRHLVRDVNRLLYEHVDRKLSLTGISRTLHIAKTRLKSHYKQQTGESIVKTFTQMKIDNAKTMIREEGYNMTEIAQSLGFSSLYHFSKVFKRITNMNPTEYAKSVKVRMDD